MSGTPRPSGLHKLHSNNGFGQATGASALVEASIPVVEFFEEGGYDVVLVVRAQKESREAAPGDAIWDLQRLLHEVGWIELRTADISDPGTCENYDGLVSDLYLCMCAARKERITYRIRGRWCRTEHFRGRPCNPTPTVTSQAPRFWLWLMGRQNFAKLALIAPNLLYSTPHQL
jgi:hypothetical protein